MILKDRQVSELCPQMSSTVDRVICFSGQRFPRRAAIMGSQENSESVGPPRRPQWKVGEGNGISGYQVRLGLGELSPWGMGDSASLNGIRGPGPGSHPQRARKGLILPSLVLRGLIF